MAVIGSVRLQADPPAFDVVSIKPVEPGRGVPPLAVAQVATMCSLNAGRFRCSGSTVLTLIRFAFLTDGTMPLTSQIVGAPDWVNTMQVNVDARADTGDAITAAQLPAALRALLEDRFRFKAHTELRPFPVYVLTIAKKDRRLGPKLRASTTDCFPPPAEMRALVPANQRCFSGTFRAGTINAPNLTMDALARRLTQLGGAERIVVDRTGLSGKFEIDLHWSADVTQPSDDPPLVTAIQEQLGLKLEPGNERLAAVVIDHIEQPSPN